MRKVQTLWTDPSERMIRTAALIFSKAHPFVETCIKSGLTTGPETLQEPRSCSKKGQNELLKGTRHLAGNTIVNTSRKQLSHRNDVLY